MKKLLLEILNAWHANPADAADKMDELANLLQERARQLRATTADGTIKSIGGISDRVTIAVVGPDGVTKQVAQA